MAGIKTSTPNIAESFRKLVDDTFIKYRGCLIEKRAGQFIALGRVCSTQAEAEQHIDNSFTNLQNTIYNGNKNESSSASNQS